MTTVKQRTRRRPLTTRQRILALFVSNTTVLHTTDIIAAVPGAEGELAAMSADGTLDSIEARGVAGGRVWGVA